MSALFYGIQKKNKYLLPRFSFSDRHPNNSENYSLINCVNMEYYLNRKKLYIEGWHLNNMHKQLVDWIIRFQRDQDIEALAHLKSYCYNIIETLIGEFTAKYGEEAGALLRLK